MVTRRSLSHLLRIQVLMRLDQESCTLITRRTHTDRQIEREREREGKKWEGKGRKGNKMKGREIKEVMKIRLRRDEMR